MQTQARSFSHVHVKHQNWRKCKLSDFHHGLILGIRHFTAVCGAGSERCWKRSKHPVGSSFVDGNDFLTREVRGESSDWSELTEILQLRSESQNPQHVKPNVVSAENHRTGQLRTGNTQPGLMNLNVRWEMQMLGSEFGSMNPWTQPVLCQQFRLLLLVWRCGDCSLGTLWDPLQHQSSFAGCSRSIADDPFRATVDYLPIATSSRIIQHHVTNQKSSPTDFMNDSDYSGLCCHHIRAQQKNCGTW